MFRSPTRGEAILGSLQVTPALRSQLGGHAEGNRLPVLTVWFGMRWDAPAVDHQVQTEEPRRSTRVELVQDVSRTALTLSLVVFFVTTVLLGANVGNPLFVEEIVAYSTLAVAVSGFAYVQLGLTVARRMGDQL